MKLVFYLLAVTSSLSALHQTLHVRHRQGGGVGYTAGYSTLDYLASLSRSVSDPLEGNHWEALFNLRGHLFNDGLKAGNVGVGLRYLLSNTSSHVGGNLFYDFREATPLFAHQVGGGVEWLSSWGNLRFNGYLPVGKRRTFEQRTFQNFKGHHLYIRRSFSATLPCVDGEIETSFFSWVSLTAGGYYLFRESRHSLPVGHAFGWKASAQLNLGSSLSAGVSCSQDPLFGRRLQSFISLEIPLGFWRPSASRAKKSLPFSRNEIIPLQTHRRSQVPFSSRKKTAPYLIFVNNQAELPGDGSFEHPFNSLKKAERHSKEGDVIYVYPGDGTPQRMHEGIILKQDQQLASAGADLTFDDVVIPAQTPGVLPVITNIHPQEPFVTHPGRSDLSTFLFISPQDYWQHNLPETPASSGWGDPSFHEWVDLRQSPSTLQSVRSFFQPLWNGGGERRD